MWVCCAVECIKGKKCVQVVEKVCKDVCKKVPETVCKEVKVNVSGLFYHILMLLELSLEELLVDHIMSVERSLVFACAFACIGLSVVEDVEGTEVYIKSEKCYLHVWH